MFKPENIERGQVMAALKRFLQCRYLVHCTLTANAIGRHQGNDATDRRRLGPFCRCPFGHCTTGTNCSRDLPSARLLLSTGRCDSFSVVEVESAVRLCENTALIVVGYLWLDGASSLREALLRSLSAKKKPYVADEANGSADRELS